jgi:hypothetical protein
MKKLYMYIYNNYMLRRYVIGLYKNGKLQSVEHEFVELNEAMRNAVDIAKYWGIPLVVNTNNVNLEVVYDQVKNPNTSTIGESS